MLEETKKFYELTKLSESHDDPEDEMPITFVKVFHKQYPRLPSIKLLDEVNNEESEFETLINLRESTRNFSDKSLTLEEVSRIIRSCRICDLDREPERRTYPSGGARFPVELYLVSFNVERLERGAYHYDVVNNRLELLLRKDLRPNQRELISPYLENPAATIIFTSIISRSEVKYGYKAYPFSFLEAGHIGQNIHLKCVELGIGSCSVSGFVDNTIKRILDLTEDEIPIYTISIGKKKKLL